MARKEPFKMHSLRAHIEDTKKGISAEAQFNRRPIARPDVVVKKEPAAFAAEVFGQSPSDSDATSSSGASSSGEGSDDDLPDLLSKTKTPKAARSTAPAKRRNKDDEIADSDAERNSPVKKAVPTKKTVRVKPEPEESEESDSESESEERGPKVHTNGAAANGSPDDSSSEAISESEIEEESSRAAGTGNKKKAKPETAGVKIAKSRVQAEESTDSDSGSESEAESESESASSVPTKPTVNGNGAYETSSTSSDGGSDSEGSDDSDGSDDSGVETASPVASEASKQRPADESMHISDREEEGQLAIPSSIAPDFVLRRGEDGANGRDVAEIFSQANMQGKQFWYFTVPSNVPVSVVQNLEIPMAHGQPGDGVFSHNGEEYGISLNRMAPRSTIQILIPSADGSEYQPAPQHIDQVMQIKKTVQLNPQPLASSSFGPAAKRGPPPQPKGLKSRYQPFGVPGPARKAITAAPADQDAAMADAPALPAPESAAAKPKQKARKQKDEAPPAVAAAAKPVEETPKATPDASMADALALSAPESAAAKPKQKARKQKDGAPPAVAAAAKPVEETPKATPAPKEKKSKQRDAIPETAASVTLSSTNGTNGATTPGTSRKGKRRLTASEDEAAAAAEQLMAETMTAESRSKKQKLDRDGSVDLGSEYASTSARKETPVLPPALPSTLFNSHTNHTQSAATPAVASQAVAPSGSTKKSRRPKTPSAAPSSSMPAPPTAAKHTPTPAPRQTAVPIPLPGASLAKSSPVSAPPVGASSADKSEKKPRKRRDKAAASEGRPGTASEPSAPGRVTPVPAPKPTGMG